LVSLVLAVVLLIIVAAEPAVMVFVIMLSYVLSGPIGLVTQLATA
jgi:CDP-diacylglycerol---serine O-phosphatidyltransferase